MQICSTNSHIVDPGGGDLCKILTLLGEDSLIQFSMTPKGGFSDLQTQSKLGPRAENGKPQK